LAHHFDSKLGCAGLMSRQVCHSAQLMGWPEYLSVYNFFLIGLMPGVSR